MEEVRGLRHADQVRRRFQGFYPVEHDSWIDHFVIFALHDQPRAGRNCYAIELPATDRRRDRDQRSGIERDRLL